MLRTGKNDTIVVSVLHARNNLGKLLSRVEEEGRSLVIEKRGAPKAVLLSIRDYARLASPEPKVLKLIGKKPERKGTQNLGPRQINKAIKATREAKKRASLIDRQ